MTRTDEITVNVARLRARVVWLAAKIRFAKGARTVRFRRSDLSRMIEIVFDQPDPFGGIEAMIAALPEDGQPTWDGDEFQLSDPESRRATPDEAEVLIVLEYWRTKTGRPERTEYTSARLGIVRARIRDGYSVEQLKKAVDGLMSSDWHVQGRYTDTSHAFKTERLERWLSAPDDGANEEVERVALQTIARRRRSI